MRLRLLLLISLTCMASSPAQTGAQPRYLIAVRDANLVPQTDFLLSLPHPLVPPEEWAIFDHDLNTNLAAIFLDPNVANDLRLNHPEYIVEQDQQMVPTDGPPEPDPTPTGWALQGLLDNHPYGLPKPAGCEPCQVTLYVVDSGVQKILGTGLHPQFGPTSPVVWGGGLMAPSLTGSGASPFIDVRNHGTGVASTAVGLDTGLFAHLHGGSVVLEPCQIYYPSAVPTAPWVSDALNAVFQASVQHLARRNDATVLNNGSVLMFANRTTTSYSELMERQLAEATKAGMVVVAAAGNQLSAADPTLPSLTPPIPPLCDPMQLVSQISPPPSTTKTPSGMPLSGLLGNPFVGPCAFYATPTAHYLLLVGGTASDGSLWSSGPNGSNYGPQTSLFAPAGEVTKASALSAPLVTGSGTSLATGYVAGLSLYYLSFRPWASVMEVRNFVLSQTSVSMSPTAGSFLSMNLELLTAPDCCLDYVTWTGVTGLVGAQGAKTLDVESDGLVNLLEWALGNDPKVNSTNRGLSFTHHDGQFWLRKTLAHYGLCGATITVEASYDLLSWEAPVPTFVPLPLISSCSAGSISEAPLGAEPPDYKFYRIRVVSP